jgi:CHAD domain-containing protein
MRTEPHPSDPQPGNPPLPGLHWQVEAWRGLLDRCTRKTSGKRIHDLRIVTLRLQAALEHWLREQAPDAVGTRAVKRWMKHGKKLRRALEPVREADVCLELLGSLHGPDPDPAPAQSDHTQRCLREIEALESRFQRQRATASEALLAAIEVHHKRLDQSSRQMEKALELPLPGAQGSAAAGAWKLFNRLTNEFQDLNGSNLHVYRKQLKKVRYLAEAGTDDEAARLASTSRKMLTAAGNWHDWHVLTAEAKRRLPKRSKQDGLLAVLRTMEAEALRRALEISRQSTAQLLAGSGEEESAAL